MTPIQEGEDDEDITLSDTHNPPPLIIQGPISRARVRQLNQHVSSFLSSSACTYENSMLPNEIIDYIVLRNFGEDQEGLGNQQGQGGRLGGGAFKSRWKPKSSRSQPSRTPGPVCTKFIVQATNGLRFQRPTYVWKDKNIRNPMEFVSDHLDFGVDVNLCHKLADRICPGCCVTYLGCWPMYRVGVP
jgi:hypothetical protein